MPFRKLLCIADIEGKRSIREHAKKNVAAFVNSIIRILDKPSSLYTFLTSHSVRIALAKFQNHNSIRDRHSRGNGNVATAKYEVVVYTYENTDGFNDTGGVTYIYIYIYIYMYVCMYISVYVVCVCLCFSSCVQYRHVRKR